MHAARTQYVHRHLPHESDHASPTKAVPQLQTIMKVAGRSSAMFDEHHLELSPDGVRRCRVCHYHGKRHRVLTRCSNVSICKNAHVCIHHFVEFHNSALHLEAANDGDGDAWQVRTPPISWKKNILFRESCTLTLKNISNRKFFIARNSQIPLPDFCTSKSQMVTWPAIRCLKNHK